MAKNKQMYQPNIGKEEAGKDSMDDQVTIRNNSDVRRGYQENRHHPIPWLISTDMKMRKNLPFPWLKDSRTGNITTCVWSDDLTPSGIPQLREYDSCNNITYR